MGKIQQLLIQSHIEIENLPKTLIDQSFPNYLERKLDAPKVYNSEMRDFPHSRSYDAVSALATVRGTSVGVAAAEAFVSVRSGTKLR